MSKLTVKEVRGRLALRNIKVRRTEYGEFRVSYAGPNSEPSAYYTDDLEDALSTGLKMANERDQKAYDYAVERGERECP